MASQVELTQYDPDTKRYVAQLTVTDGEKVSQYTCEGTWHAEDAEMVAGSLYDQHKVVMAKEAKVDAEKLAITTAILSEVDKKAAAAAGVN